MPSANEIMSGLTSVISAVDTYSSRITESNPVNKILTSYDAFLGAVAQGKDGIRNYLPSEEIDSLTDNINKQLETCIKLERSPLKQAKMRFAAANLEASLKGFELPLEKNTAFDNLSYAGLEEKEVLEKAIPAVKEAIIKLNGEHVSRKEYAQAVINEALNNLPAELQKEREEKQKQDKGVNIVTEGKEQTQPTPPGYKPSISTSTRSSFAESVKKSRESEQQSGRSK